MIRRVLIRADGDETIGIGHVMRCIVLANELKERGFEVIWATATANESLLSRIKQVSRYLYHIKIHSDLFETLKIIDFSKPFFIILDGYHFDSSYQKTIYDSGSNVVIIDDYCHLNKYYAHLIINQNYSANQFKYNAMPNTKYLLGMKYVLLRKEFLRYRGIQKEIKDLAQSILVTMGGGDSLGNTIKVLSALKRIEIPLNLKIVLGACNKETQNIRTALIGNQHTVEINHDAKNMPELMHWADIGIAAGGTTTWELLYMGVPTFLCITTDNQEAIVQSLAKDGIVKSLGWLNDKELISIANNIEDFIKDKSTRKQMSKKSNALIDGKGKHRIVNELKSLCFDIHHSDS